MLTELDIVASPGESEGQRTGSFDGCIDIHDKCASCRKKRLGKDSGVVGDSCEIYDNFSDIQRKTLASPSYMIRTEKKELPHLNPILCVIPGICCHE